MQTRSSFKTGGVICSPLHGTYVRYRGERKMPRCRRCQGEFPCTAIVDGKKRVLSSRRYCLTCSPFGAHNTRKLEVRPANQYQVCRVCQAEIKKGRGQYVGICHSCRVTEWRQKTKKRAVDYLGGRCRLCGYDRCLMALQFHHVDPAQKDFTIADANASWETVRAELTKCVLLCALCHIEVHAGVLGLDERAPKRGRQGNC